MKSFIFVIVFGGGGLYALLSAAQVKVSTNRHDTILREYAKEQKKLDANFVGPPAPKKVVRRSDLTGDSRLVKKLR